MVAFLTHPFFILHFSFLTLYPSASMKLPDHWLVKTEPEIYSYQDLERETETVWEGVRNPMALKHLRLIKPGDLDFIYHTGSQRAIVGIVEAISKPFPDPRSKNPRRLR